MTAVDFNVSIEPLEDDEDWMDEDAMTVEHPGPKPELVEGGAVPEEEPKQRSQINTITLEMSIDSDDLPTYGSGGEAWDEWGNRCIRDYAKQYIGPDQGVFAEITEVTSLHRDEEFDHIVGKSWEWPA